MDAALQLAVKGGVAAITASGVARAVGAPSGSVYHRFGSRDLLLARLWLRTVERFQDEFLNALKAKDAGEAALKAVRQVISWCRESPAEAALLLLYRREDLIAGDWPAEVSEQAARLAEELETGLTAIVKRLELPRERVVFALIDLPQAAVRPYLRRGKAPPKERESLALEAIQALLSR